MASGWLCLNLASSKKTKQTKKRWIYQAILVKPREVRSLTASQFQKKKLTFLLYLPVFVIEKFHSKSYHIFPPRDLHQWINHRAWSAELRFPPWIRALANDTAQDAWASVGSRKFNIAISLWVKNIRYLSPKCFFITWRFLSFFAVYLRIITGTQQIKWHPNLWIQHNPEPSCSKHIDLPTSTNLHPKTHMYTLHGFNERPAVKAAFGCPVKPRCAGLGLGGGCRCRRLRGKRSLMIEICWSLWGVTIVSTI